MQTKLTISGRRGRGPVGIPLPTPGPPCIRSGICPLIRGPIIGPSGPGKRGPIGGPCLGPPGPWKCIGISGLRCGPCTPLRPIGPGGLNTFRLPIGSPGARARTDKEKIIYIHIRCKINIFTFLQYPVRSIFTARSSLVHVRFHSEKSKVFLIYHRCQLT